MNSNVILYVITIQFFKTDDRPCECETTTIQIIGKHNGVKFNTAGSMFSFPTYETSVVKKIRNPAAIAQELFSYLLIN